MQKRSHPGNPDRMPAGPHPRNRDRDGHADVDGYYRIVASWLDRSLRDRGDGEWWSDRIADGTSGRVIELGCGTGRLTTAFAGEGRQVIGLDRSEAMLDRARARLAGRADVLLIRGDLRDLPFRDASIRWVVAPADPLIHLVTDGDRQRAIDEAARVLLSGGRLLLESLWWTPAEEERARSAGGLRHVRAPAGADSDTLIVREHWQESAADGSLRGTYQYRIGGRIAAEATFRGRRWTCEELDRRLRAAGLEPVRRWGGFDGRSFEPDTARALLVEAVSVRSG